MRLPPEWIPTFVGAGILAVAGYGLLFVSWFNERRRAKKSNASRTQP
jgi:hypothetical protein